MIQTKIIASLGGLKIVWGKILCAIHFDESKRLGSKTLGARGFCT